MYLVKSKDYFDPSKVPDPITIIGCGSVGSCLGEHLARYGISKFVLWDADFVEEKNIVNQMFTLADVGRPKVEALADIIHRINPDAEVKTNNKMWEGDRLVGYVFMCVDKMAVRKKIAESLRFNPVIKGIFDARTGLTDAQMYAARPMQVDRILKSMDYTDEEALAETPMTACGTVLGVATTVRLIVDMLVANFVRYVKTNSLVQLAIVNMETLETLILIRD